MIQTIHLQLTDPGNAWTDRERHLLQMLVLHICAHTNYRILGKPMRVRPMVVSSIHLLLNHQLQFEDPVSEAEVKPFLESLQVELERTLSLCHLQKADILLLTESD
ncbi:MAG: hypothetical protein OWQ59_04940 [Alicyclobacillaceae bacterium]|jgi:hypothetical protein|uniref:hypothetical protein n=1 Tax=Alicyclobacillus sp. SP_1 TaxID=2942475 RepID=UPI0021570B7E|nr:hypothetical protein [Alicyclobacillus sp. SP_1]MCY0887786.1 hypothetical protein [Alicyclobacillaceae bacterium]MCY0896065.1 hypothetical protein [Alicyclobacillaceae bacterium]